uniref:Secreted protein n=1 Tax=Steinernema glaseri TaxID=37863 RepID=A0A1I7ZPI4_9BILA
MYIYVQILLRSHKGQAFSVGLVRIVSSFYFFLCRATSSSQVDQPEEHRLKSTTQGFPSPHPVKPPFLTVPVKGEKYTRRGCLIQFFICPRAAVAHLTILMCDVIGN